MIGSSREADRARVMDEVLDEPPGRTVERAGDVVAALRPRPSFPCPRR